MFRGFSIFAALVFLCTTSASAITHRFQFDPFDNSYGRYDLDSDGYYDVRLSGKDDFPFYAIFDFFTFPWDLRDLYTDIDVYENTASFTDLIFNSDNSLRVFSPGDIVKPGGPDKYGSVKPSPGESSYIGLVTRRGTVTQRRWNGFNETEFDRTPKTNFVYAELLNINGELVIGEIGYNTNGAGAFIPTETVSQIPLPASALLLATSLVGLRLRKRQSC